METNTTYTATSEACSHAWAHIWQILPLLLGAFILGYLIRRFLSSGGSSDNNQNLDECNRRYADLEAKYKSLEAANMKVSAAAPVSAATAVAAKSIKLPKGVKMDDLKIVEGIGPKIEGLLKNGGFDTWAKLSKANVTELQSILDAAGPNYKIANPKTWAEQAGIAAQGKWAELKEYQDFLIGGLDPK